MKLREYYEDEALRVETGTGLGGRIVKVGSLFKRSLGSAKRLLDVGCGVGGHTLHLGRLLSAKELCGVDISQRRVEVARSKGVVAEQADMNKDPLPFPDGYFDAVFCGEVIEHLVDPDNLLREIKRVLTHNGVCVLTTPNLAMWPNRITLLFGFQPFYTNGSFEYPSVGKPAFLSGADLGGSHLRVLTHRALVELLGLHGFEIVKTSGCTLYETTMPCGSLQVRILGLLLWPLDSFLSLFPSLSCISLAAVRKVKA